MPKPLILHASLRFLFVLFVSVLIENVCLCMQVAADGPSQDLAPQMPKPLLHAPLRLPPHHDCRLDDARSGRHLPSARGCRAGRSAHW